MAGPNIVATVAAAFLQTFGIRGATEQPSYQVVERIGPIEIRQYQGRIAAEALAGGDEASARNDGFRLIAGYIFGGNTSAAQIAMTAPVAQTGKGEQIAMTAPVAQQSSQAGWRIQFFMPAEYDMASLPKPKDARVSLVQLPPQTFAVLSFSGSRSRAAVTSQQKALAAELGKVGWTAAGEPQQWFYDPPWTLPFLRRNEVAVQVQRKTTR